MICHLQRISLAVVAAAMSTLSLTTLAGQPPTESESLRWGLAQPEVAGIARGRIGEATHLTSRSSRSPTGFFFSNGSMSCVVMLVMSAGAI